MDTFCNHTIKKANTLKEGGCKIEPKCPPYGGGGPGLDHCSAKGQGPGPERELVPCELVGGCMAPFSGIPCRKETPMVSLRNRHNGSLF